jgi:hypothetical protein
VFRRGGAGASAEALAPMVPILGQAFAAACAVLEAARAEVARRTA